MPTWDPSATRRSTVDLGGGESSRAREREWRTGALHRRQRRTRIAGSSAPGCGSPGRHRRATVPLHPARALGVENNLNIANIDWEDFASAVDESGVFRGFPA